MNRKRGRQLPKRSETAEEKLFPSASTAVERARLLVAEGARLLSARRPGEAAELLIEARSLDPHNAAAAINLGGAYILQGKHDRAIPVLEEAVHLAPGDPMAWTNLAAAYLGRLTLATRERQDRAIRAFEHALAIDPRTPHVHYNLALIYLERRDLSQAAAHFWSALETDPNDKDARLWLERLQHSQQGDGATQGSL